jgi:hypothetical protein
MAGIGTADTTVSGSFRHDNDSAAFYPVRSKILVMTLGSVAMAALGLAMSADVIPVRAGTVSRVVLSVGGVFFAAVAIFWAQQLSIRGAAIEVSRIGFRDTRLSQQLIPWTAFERIGVHRAYRQRMLVLHLHRGALATIKRPALRIVLDSCNTLFGLSGVYVNPKALSGTIDDILAAIDRLAPPSVGRD